MTADNRERLSALRPVRRRSGPCPRFRAQGALLQEARCGAVYWISAFAARRIRMTLSLPNAPNGPLSLQGEGWGEGTEFIQTPTAPGKRHSRASSLLRRAPRCRLQDRYEAKRHPPPAADASHHVPYARPPFSAAAYNRSASAARYSSALKVPSSTSSLRAPQVRRSGQQAQQIDQGRLAGLGGVVKLRRGGALEGMGTWAAGRADRTGWRTGLEFRRIRRRPARPAHNTGAAMLSARTLAQAPESSVGTPIPNRPVGRLGDVRELSWGCQSEAQGGGGNTVDDMAAEGG